MRWEREREKLVFGERESGWDDPLNVNSTLHKDRDKFKINCS